MKDFEMRLGTCGTPDMRQQYFYISIEPYLLKYEKEG